jgi:hypothetical protein
VQEIVGNPWTEVQQAIQDIMSPIPQTYDELINEEFQALVYASENGAPPIQGPSPTSPVIFEVNPNLVRTFPGPEGTRFRIAPILRLRTVTGQIGYRREVDTGTPAVPVDISFPDPASPNQNWYPGVEYLGEGVFMMLDDNEGWHSDMEGRSTSVWMGAQGEPSYPSFVFRSPQDRGELHPLFIWWHTLSHLIIRAVSLEAGYSSASIRERVYVQRDNRARGGILLYATQPGSEGGLGGLIALVPYFGEILRRAFDMLDTCSGDPLCIENRFNPGNYNGAACYACLLISETSCEHRNMWLDRNVLRENIP